MAPRSEAMARFLAQHAVDNATAVARDAAPYVGMSLEEHARHLVAVCRLTADILRARPDGDRIIALVEPPHPDWVALTRPERR